MAPGRMPIAGHLHAVGVAPIDDRVHDPGGQHLASRNQRFDLGQLGVLFLAAPPCLGERSNRNHETGPPLQANQPTDRVGCGSQRTVAVLGCQRMQPALSRLESWLTPTAQMPLLERIERPRP